MRFPTPINPNHIAPASARRVSVTFTADRSGDGWAVSQNTTWRDRDGPWDADCTRVAKGLSEVEARALALRLSGYPAAERAAGQRRAA